jgi:hypothetical protein
MARITDAELLVRVNTVVELIVQGANAQSIVKYCDKHFSVSERTAFNYLASAKEQIKENSIIDTQYQIGKALFRFEKLYKENYKLGDYRECRALLDSQSKLLGLNAPDKQEIDHKSGGKEMETATVIMFTRGSRAGGDETK